MAALQKDDSGKLVLPTVEDECLGMKIRIEPWILSQDPLDWAIVALVCELSPIGDSSHVTLEQILSFNSSFRSCRGKPERQDTPLRSQVALHFGLSSGLLPAQIYERVARQVLGSYEPPPDLKKAVTLSLAVFDRELNDQELYLFGTIAHDDEHVGPAWAKRMVQDGVYDRWQPLGWRFLAHNYSLVCACHTGGVSSGVATSQDLAELRQRFMRDYVRMGVNFTLERAIVLDFGARLKGASRFDQVRPLRETWVDFRRVLGTRWATEGMQRLQIEKLWRHVSEQDDRAEEVDRRLDQTIRFFEAEAAVRLSTLIVLLNCFFLGFSACGITFQFMGDFAWWVRVASSLGCGLSVGLIFWRFRRLLGIPTLLDRSPPLQRHR